MLASEELDLDARRYPLVVSPKLDGIRCMLCGGRAYTRSLKQVPNNFVRKTLENLSSRFPDWLFDGELIVGKTFQETSSAVMSRRGTPDFTFAIFDFVHGPLSFHSAYRSRRQHFFAHRQDDLFMLERMPSWVSIVEHREVLGPMELEKAIVNFGGEGVICRDPLGPYKFGRSTSSEGYMWKIKHFKDSEATVVGVVEMLHNYNTPTKSAIGLTERSTHKYNQMPAGMLGALEVEDKKMFPGQRFTVGTGFTWDQRVALWDKWPMGKTIKYKYQPFGVKDKPRAPIFLGFRDEKDMS